MGYSANRPDRVQEMLLGDSEQRERQRPRTYLPHTPISGRQRPALLPETDAVPHPAHRLDSLDPTTTPDMTA